MASEDCKRNLSQLSAEESEMDHHDNKKARSDERVNIHLNNTLYGEWLKNPREKLLNVDDIQGDVILGFNKPFNAEILIDLKNANDVDSIKRVKTWLKDTITPMITTTRDVLEHRQANRSTGNFVCEKSQLNISFSYSCIQVLLDGTAKEADLSLFDPNSSFVLGAALRSTTLGDSRDDWQFGADSNNHILINIAADKYQILDRTYQDIKGSLGVDLKIVNKTVAFRGNPGDALYGHEHFGFLDGLSQPEIRGKYVKRATSSHKVASAAEPVYDFIVKRRLLATNEDPRYQDYSAPGFYLMDTGHFLLGYLENFPDTQDGAMQNPHADNYRTLQQKYPDWCKNGSYVVYRKIKQDVPGFWNYFLEEAKSILPADSTEEVLHNKAGFLASQAIGRWWDGTPVNLVQNTGTPIGPLSEHSYPPASNVEVMEKPRNGLLNGFMFDIAEPAWTVLNPDGTLLTVPTKNQGTYVSDSAGTLCPFGGHIRKVNPRDEFTDIGSNVQTMKHRIIRRGNNYFDNDEVPSDGFYGRVKNVFKPTDIELEHDRGLALVMYQSSIEDQFEFVQRHWANSSSRPRATGDDMIIGLKSSVAPSSNTTSSSATPQCPFSKSLSFTDWDDKGNATARTMKTSTNFTSSVGMGYFLLPAVSTISEILCASPLITPEIERLISYHAPANLNDFLLPSSKFAWDWTMRSLYSNCVWTSCNASAQGNASILPGYTDMKGAGIGYRLPNIKELVSTYAVTKGKGMPKMNYLQFRSTDDLNILAEATQQTVTYVTISWQGFPKRILDLVSNSNINPYQYVETLGWPSTDVTYRHYTAAPIARQMDEYCEWFTYRNSSNNKITRVDISCESPEYWSFLFANEPDVCLKLYQQYVSPLATMADLIAIDGNYNIYNKWNTTEGIMHLNCPPNSLFAEVYIAAEASTFWGKPDYPSVVAITGGDLITSGKYGLPTRASDPTIGANINSFIRSGLIVSVSNPTGLYLENLNTTGWTKPNNVPFTAEEISKIVTYPRKGVYADDATVNMNVRVQIEIPADFMVDGKPYSLGDCKIGGAAIDWAGQIVDSSVTVFLRGAAIDGHKKGFELIHADASTAAIVPPKISWNGVDIGPKYTYNQLYPSPEPYFKQAPP